MNHPKISIITVVFNAVKTLEQTILSVINQTYKNIEYIIIDGGSTDGTLDIIKKHEDNIAYWVSEPDNGIYDAMNKGIENAKGLFTIFVNSGDYLYNNIVINEVASYFDNIHEFDMIYGRSKKINARGDISDLIVKHNLDQLWKGPTFRHGALFTKTELLKKFKFELSSSLKIAADFNFIYKMHKMNYKFQSVDIVICSFLEEGISDDPYKHIQDCKYILKKNGDWDIKRKIYHLYRHFRLIISKSFFKKLHTAFRLFFYNYFSNYWINKIPFYFLRHLYYKKIMGIFIGKGSSIHLNCFIFGTNIIIGENSTINRSCYLDGRGRLKIGNNVSISPEVHLITDDHDYNSPNFSGRSRDVVINDYVWIGTRATILPGIHIGEGAVICAGAVVTKNVSAFDVVAGVPAVKIKERNKNLHYNPSWLPYFD